MHLNHTIVHASRKERSAHFLAELLGLPPPRRWGPFSVLQVDPDLSLDFMDHQGTIQPQHYAFLVTEAEFDGIYDRIRAADVQHWADPGQREAGRINTRDGGRGVYFADPDGHLMEALTRPYDSGGSTVTAPAGAKDAGAG